VDEIAAEFEARPELRAALERPDRQAQRVPRRRPVATPQRPQRPQQRRWRCGTGDFLCPNFLPRRGLCPSCGERLEARVGKLERGRPRKVGTEAKQPPAKVIDPAEVFDAGGRTRVPAAERAAWMARWVHRVGGPVRRADAVRVAGMQPNGSSSNGILTAAETAGWITRGPAGSVLPGDVPA
jgi:hypothetical protein